MLWFCTLAQEKLLYKIKKHLNNWVNAYYHTSLDKCGLVHLHVLEMCESNLIEEGEMVWAHKTTVAMVWHFGLEKFHVASNGTRVSNGTTLSLLQYIAIHPYMYLRGGPKQTLYKC